MQSWYVDEWQDRGLFLEATFTPLPFSAHWLPGVGEELKAGIERFENLGVIGVHLSERSEGRVSASGRVTYKLRDDDARELVYGIGRAADLLFAAGAVEVYPQIHGVARLAPGEQTALADGRFGPGDLRLEAFHPLGTARMGADAGAAAVGPTGESHAVPGLWIADASLMPTSLKVNPMITVMACARRVAGQLAARLG
jgi:choline dehydrogenase-like flavoprotein